MKPNDIDIHRALAGIQYATELAHGERLPDGRMAVPREQWLETLAACRVLRNERDDAIRLHEHEQKLRLEAERFYWETACRLSIQRGEYARWFGYGMLAAAMIIAACLYGSRP
jgi:hypothetical protein